MYLELFLLDNLLMNLLVLRLACAFCARPCVYMRILAMAAAGALYALLTLNISFAGHWVWRLLCAGVMALGIPNGRSPKSFFYAWLCVLLSAWMLGGCLLMLAYMTGQAGKEGLQGLSLRAALGGACAVAFLPRLWREKQMWHRSFVLHILQDGKNMPCRPE